MSRAQPQEPEVKESEKSEKASKDIKAEAPQGLGGGRKEHVSFPPKGWEIELS